MPVRVRGYEAADFEFVRGLFEGSLAEEKNRVPVLGLPDDFAESYLPRLIQEAAEEHGSVLVAEVDSERSGFIAALPKEAQAWDQSHQKVVMIMELHVAAGHRRRGVGRALMEAVERKFALDGFDWATLGTMAGNTAAHSMYRALGFEVTYLFMGKRLRAQA